MQNKVFLTGNLGNAPEFKKTQMGQDMAFFSLATGFSWKDENGEWNKHVDWHHIAVFKDSTIRWMKNLLKKGALVTVEGRLMYKEWKDKEGRNHREARVVISNKEGQVQLFQFSKTPPQDAIDTEENDDEDSIEDLFNGNMPPEAIPSSTPPSNTNLQSTQLQ